MIDSSSCSTAVLISLYQIITNLGSVFTIPFPPFYQAATSGVGNLFQVDLPTLMPLDCIIRTSYYSRLIVRCVFPLAIYIVFYGGARLLHRCGREWQASKLIDTNFFIAFLVYPSIAAKAFSIFNCEELEDGSSVLRVDLSLKCRDSDGAADPTYSLMVIFAILMIIIHVAGTPAIYAYLFFFKHGKTMSQLKQQELDDAYREKLTSSDRITDEQKAELDRMGNADRIDADAVLPGYMKKLIGGFEYRTYWFEIFETIRKVLLVGVPAVGFEPGGALQLFWGLLVCFITFGMYMMVSRRALSTVDRGAVTACAPLPSCLFVLLSHSRRCLITLPHSASL